MALIYDACTLSIKMYANFIKCLLGISWNVFASYRRARCAILPFWYLVSFRHIFATFVRMFNITVDDISYNYVPVHRCPGMALMMIPIFGPPCQNCHKQIFLFFYDPKVYAWHVTTLYAVFSRNSIPRPCSAIWTNDRWDFILDARL